jgi:hypothetical protein
MKKITMLWAASALVGFIAAGCTVESTSDNPVEGGTAGATGTGGGGTAGATGTGGGGTGGAQADAATDTGAVAAWDLPKACDTCLSTNCTDYTPCKANAACAAQFAKVATCIKEDSIDTCISIVGGTEAGMSQAADLGNCLGGAKCDVACGQASGSDAAAD